MKDKISISNITEMAKLYQKNVYPNGAPPIQLIETEQAYLAGFYEALQVTRQLPQEKLKDAENELREWFDKRLAEMFKRRT